ncbi:MAG TPA: clan AA aspartic protease [Blastocatellia bacterium]|nr:clan AA aspartic protease [Blastocatellia bacterium]
MRENLTPTLIKATLLRTGIWCLHVCPRREKARGLIHLTTTLRAREKARRKYAAEFLVDTGATDGLEPAKELKKAGIKPRGRMAYELADGRTVEYDFGLVEIEFMGEMTSGRVIFGPDDAEPLLGVTALESVGILVDPTTRTLERMPAIPLK